MKVGIVLINYQDYAHKFLIPCRDALRRQKFSRGEFCVYLIDNASSSESLKYLRDNFPEAKILPRADGNYCAASNLGFQEVIKDSCDYLVALNMDTEVSENWLEELVIALEKNPKAGLAQSLIYLFPKNEAEKSAPRINTTGNIINFLFFGMTSNYGKTLQETKLDSDSYPEIAYPSGCSFIIRSEVFGEIGGYNEDYYMYHDDLSLGLKARLVGWEIILAPKSSLFHKYEFARNTRNFYYLERNRQLIYRAFYSPLDRILLVPLFFMMEFGLLGFSILGGWFPTKLKIYREIFSSNFINQVKKERIELRKIAKVSKKEVILSFSGKVKFAEIDNFILSYLVNPVFNFYWQIIKHFI